MSTFLPPVPRSSRRCCPGWRAWRGLLLGLALPLLGCGPAFTGLPEEGPLVEGSGPGFDPLRATLEPGEARGSLQRQEVDEGLRLGPQAFLAQVRVTPASLEGRFVGFRLEELFPGDPRFAGLDLHPGDVITRVNGRPIESPDQFLGLWESLKTSPSLAVEYLRGGMVRVLRWQIVDDRVLQPTLVP